MVLEPIGGTDKDAARNVWHFETAAAPEPVTLGNIGAGLADFYSTISAFLAPTVDRAANAHRVELAQVTQGGAGEADDQISRLLATRPFGLNEVANSAAYPSEVAVAFSFRGDIAGVPEEAANGLTRPASRRRGRVFLGPLTLQSAQEEATSKVARVKVTLRELIIARYQAAKVLWEPVEAARARHIVYSRAGAETWPVTRVHVDGEFDTVRRRGVRSLERTGADVIPPNI